MLILRLRYFNIWFSYYLTEVLPSLIIKRSFFADAKYQNSKNQQHFGNELDFISFFRDWFRLPEQILIIFLVWHGLIKIKFNNNFMSYLSDYLYRAKHYSWSRIFYSVVHSVVPVATLFHVCTNPIYPKHMN